MYISLHLGLLIFILNFKSLWKTQICNCNTIILFFLIVFRIQNFLYLDFCQSYKIFKNFFWIFCVQLLRIIFFAESRIFIFVISYIFGHSSDSNSKFTGYTKISVLNTKEVNYNSGFRKGEYLQEFWKIFDQKYKLRWGREMHLNVALRIHVIQNYLPFYFCHRKKCKFFWSPFWTWIFYFLLNYRNFS